MAREILIIETLQLAHMSHRLIGIEDLRWCYLGDNWQIYSALNKVLNTFGEEISGGLFINNKAREIRRKYLNYEEILSEEHNKLLWESTDLAEKSLVNNSLFIDICKSLVFLDIVNQNKGNLIFIVDDLFLGQFLRSLSNKKEVGNVGYYNSVNLKTRNELFAEYFKITKAWKQRGLSEINILSKKLLSQQNYVKEIRKEKAKTVITKKAIDTLIVVWGTPSSFYKDKFKYSDLEYGDLPGELKKCSNNIAYLVIPVDWQYTFEDIIKNAIDSKDKVYTVQDCFHIEEAKKLALKGNCESIQLKDRLVINGIDFTQLLKKSFIHEKCKSRQYWALNFYYIGKYFFNNHIKIKNILIGYENQPWEKLLRYGFRKWMPDTQICQYVHGTIGSFWLSAFPGHKDITKGNMPDTLAVFSENCKKQFIEEGFKKNQLTVWPAFKYRKYFNANESFKARAVLDVNKDTLCVLISLNISKDDSLELLLKTFISSKGLKPIEYRLRFHPRMGEESHIINQLIQLCNWDVIPGNILIKSKNTIQEDLDWADVVLLQGSGVEIEAAIRGCHTVFVNSDCNINVNYMDLEEHNEVVSTGREIRNILINLCQNRSHLTKDPWSRKKLEYYFEPIEECNLYKVYNTLSCVKPEPALFE